MGCSNNAVKELMPPCDAHLLQADNPPAALASRQPLLHLSQFGLGLPAQQECPKPFLENHNSNRHICFSKTAFFNQLIEYDTHAKFFIGDL